MKIKITGILKQSNYLPVLLIVWIIVQAGILWHYGIVTKLEAEKYISEAEHFLQYGKLTSANYWLYSTQIFLIAAAMKMHLSFLVIVIIQMALNLFSTWMFYKLALHFLKNSFLSFLATFIFIINIIYQVYNSFLFTESVFYSLSVIYSSYLLRIDKLNIKNVIGIILMLALLSITRPTGILFLGATMLYIFSRFMIRLPVLHNVVIICSLAAIFFISINSMLHSGGSLDFMQPFRQENIICGVNTTDSADIQILKDGNSLEGLLYYMRHNVSQFLRLAKLKTISFFGLVRSYYSSLHNVYLVLFFYPFYFLCIVGLVKMIRRKNKTIVYLLSIILLYWITTLLTCDDWHSRFILTVFPFIFLIGFAAFTTSETDLQEKVS